MQDAATDHGGEQEAAQKKQRRRMIDRLTKKKATSDRRTRAPCTTHYAPCTTSTAGVLLAAWGGWRVRALRGWAGWASCCWRAAPASLLRSEEEPASNKAGSAAARRHGWSYSTT